MDIADVEKKLKQLGSWETKKECMFCQIAELEDAKVKLRVHDDIAQHLSMIESEKEKITDEIEQGIIEHSRINAALKALPDPYGELLKLRYVKGRKWFEIARKIDYSEPYVRKELKNRALQMLADLLEE